MDKSGGMTAAMLDCIGAETRIQDARLNGSYKKLMAQLNPKRKKELIEVQRLWIRFRDGNCRFYEDPEGGTMVQLAAAGCFLSATARRAKELENLTE